LPVGATAASQPRLTRVSYWTKPPRADPLIAETIAFFAISIIPESLVFIFGFLSI
jgi:hypothetical protein